MCLVRSILNKFELVVLHICNFYIRARYKIFKTLRKPQFQRIGKKLDNLSWNLFKTIFFYQTKKFFLILKFLQESNKRLMLIDTKYFICYNLQCNNFIYNNFIKAANKNFTFNIINFLNRLMKKRTKFLLDNFSEE